MNVTVAMSRIGESIQGMIYIDINSYFIHFEHCLNGNILCSQWNVLRHEACS